jgi:hypothetical protein
MKLGLMLAAAALAQGDPDTPREPGPEPQEPAIQAASGSIPYPASFFAEQRPNNAFEMLQRLPGFTSTPGPRCAASPAPPAMC